MAMHRELGWGSAPVVFPLFKDISARDLLQSRDTDNTTGDTVWRDSPLVVAAKQGVPIILDNLHAARADAVLGSLARLLEDREVELPDGTLLKAAHRISPEVVARQHAPNAEARRTVIEIPPTFRVIALGCSDDPRNVLSEEVAALFSTHMLPPLTPEQLGVVAHRRYPKAPAQRVSKLCALSRALTANVEANKARLTEAERRTLRLSPRLLSRLCRALEADPDLPNTELARGLSDGLLAPFMPKATRALVSDAMEEVGLPRLQDYVATPEEDSLTDNNIVEAAQLEMAAAEREQMQVTAAITVEEDAASGQRWLCVEGGGARVAVSVPARPELVPNHQGAFFSNHAQEALLVTMLRAVSADERALLLIGSQGVGKNRLADRLIGLLGREREYIQLHRDSTLSSLTVIPSLEDGKIVWHDSPLLRAARHGRILLVDEADKAPLEVVALLKQLVEDGSVLLGNGQRLARHSSEDGAEADGEEADSEVVRIHPDFVSDTQSRPRSSAARLPV